MKKANFSKKNLTSNKGSSLPKKTVEIEKKEDVIVDDMALKIAYDIIEPAETDIVNNENLRKIGGISTGAITQYNFQKSLEESIAILQKLEDLGLIKYEGLGGWKGWPNINFGIPVHLLKVRFLKFVNMTYVPKKQKEKNEAKYENGILHFMDKEIDFKNKQNQKDLLKTLFKDSKRNWSYDEIQEDWDEVGIDKEKYPKDFWRKFYSAGDDINTAIAKKTQIEDFIIKNTKEIQINPKYI